MELKIKLKIIRKKHGYTQANFAKFLDIPYSSYQKYELGGNEASSSTLFKIVEKFPQYALWLMTEQANIDVTQVSPSDQDVKINIAAAVPVELLNAAFEQTLTTSIELGWVTPKEGVNFGMLADLLRHDFVQQGGRLIEPISDDVASAEAG